MPPREPTRETPSTPTLGPALRAAREAAKASVEQVSAETRLRATVILDLERDSFRSSGGVVYARGHVKSIARAVGADPEPLLALIPSVELPAAELAEPAPLTHEVTSFGGSAFAGAAAALVPERQGPRWGLALSGACAALVGILAIGYANQSSPPPAPIGLPITTPSATGSAAPSPTAAPSVQAPDPNAVAARPEVTGAQLRIRLIGGRSWVSVSGSAGKTLFEGTLQDGEFRDFSDPTRLKIILGNARAVSLNCDGTDSGPAGGSGSVARFACTTAGLTAL